MSRRAGGSAAPFPELRAGLIAHYQRFADDMPGSGFESVVADLRAGQPLTFDETVMFRALAHVDTAAAKPFAWINQPRPQTFTLDEQDRLSAAPRPTKETTA